MNEYKPGDQVIVTKIRRPGMNDAMCALAGTVLTIESYRRASLYQYNCANSPWGWNDDMFDGLFEPVSKEEKQSFEALLF